MGLLEVNNPNDWENRSKTKVHIGFAVKHNQRENSNSGLHSIGYPVLNMVQSII